MPTLTILRGVPGSGKSSFAQTLNGVKVSADHYFIDEEGEYVFNPALLGEAHGACLHAAIRCCEKGVSVVVDNTNTQLFEMSPYVLLAQAYGYDLRIVRVLADPQVCATRNIHGVPAGTILRMAQGMEEVLPFWPKEETVGPFE